MARPSPEETDLHLRRLAGLLAAKPGALFRRVGGVVALRVVGHEPEHWSVRLAAAGGVELVPEPAPSPIVTIGLRPSALARLVDGTLDVERAFRERRLAVEGDLQALDRFAACFLPSGSMVGIRSS